MFRWENSRNKVVNLMDKISVTIRVPALDNKYDFMIPDNMDVNDVKSLVARILESEYGVNGKINDLMLFDLSDGKVLREDCNFKQLEIYDGTELLLM